MKRFASSPSKRRQSSRAVRAVRKGIPRSLAAKVGNIRRQKVTKDFVPRAAHRAVLDCDYLQLTIRCWVVRMLFTFLQIGGELRETALDALIATPGRKGFRWVEMRYVSWLLTAHRAEHFLRPFDATSRRLILALSQVQNEHVVVATVMYLRIVVVEGARARSWLDTVARLGEAAFDLVTMRAHCPRQCPRAYTPLGKDYMFCIVLLVFCERDLT